MDTLREFLLARILEEEALAQAAIDTHPEGHAWSAESSDADSAHFTRWNPWRVLSSCVAKRLIIAAHRDMGTGLDRRADPDRALKAHACSTCGQYDEYAIEWPCYTLRVLALDWVDHPQYRTEWRPQRLSSGVGRAVPPPPSTSPSTSTPSPTSTPVHVQAQSSAQKPMNTPTQRPPQAPAPPASSAGPGASGASGQPAA